MVTCHLILYLYYHFVSILLSVYPKRFSKKKEEIESSDLPTTKKNLTLIGGFQCKDPKLKTRTLLLRKNS